jgi:hypothetical protein
MKSPAHWLTYINKERTPPTPAMVLGSFGHALILEPETIDRKFLIVDIDSMPEPTKDFRTKANADWKRQLYEDAGERIVVLPETFDIATRCVDATLNEPEARRYLAGIKEEQIFWSYASLECTGILDIRGDGYVADLKFLRSADPRDFARDLFKNGRYRQGGMYLDGLHGGEFVGDPDYDFVFIAVETEEPHGVSVHRLDTEVIALGVSEYRSLARQLNDCLQADYFPGYMHRSISGAFDVTLPNWMYYEY